MPLRSWIPPHKHIFYTNYFLTITQQRSTHIQRLEQERKNVFKSKNSFDFRCLNKDISFSCSTIFVRLVYMKLDESCKLGLIWTRRNFRLKEHPDWLDSRIIWCIYSNSILKYPPAEAAVVSGEIGIRSIFASLTNYFFIP